MNLIVMGGCGQVGKALSNIFQKNEWNVHVLDKKIKYTPPIKRSYDFLHVTIPYSAETFHSTVKKAMRTYKPKYTVIHSTVPIGTTRRLGKTAVHSPVRGQHDGLEGGLKKFRKYVAGVDPKTTTAVSDHLNFCGIPVERWSKPEETEAMKLLCLSRYLNDIAFYEMAFRTCKRFKVSPSRLIQWTYTYNDGYHGTKWMRPELTFPMGKVGGHCVIPVSKILSNQTGYKWFRANLDLFNGEGNIDGE